MINRKKAFLFCLGFLFAQLILNIGLGKTYAMEALDEKIKQAMEKSNPQQYEMNIILRDLDIKNWAWPSLASDEIDYPVDEPLGEYSLEELKKYTERGLEVDVDYGFGRLWEGKKDKFIQVVRIYEKGELISCSFEVWVAGAIDTGGTRLRYSRMQ